MEFCDAWPDVVQMDKFWDFATQKRGGRGQVEDKKVEGGGGEGVGAALWLMPVDCAHSQVQVRNN